MNIQTDMFPPSLPPTLKIIPLITIIACEHTPNIKHGSYVLVHTINWMWLIGWASQWYPKKILWVSFPLFSLSTEHHKNNSWACLGMLWKTCWEQEWEDEERRSWKLTMLYQGGKGIIVYSLIIRTSCSFPWLQQTASASIWKQSLYVYSRLKREWKESMLHPQLPRFLYQLLQKLGK